MTTHHWNADDGWVHRHDPLVFVKSTLRSSRRSRCRPRRRRGRRRRGRRLIDPYRLQEHPQHVIDGVRIIVDIREADDEAPAFAKRIGDRVHV